MAGTLLHLQLLNPRLLLLHPLTTLTKIVELNLASNLSPTLTLSVQLGRLLTLQNLPSWKRKRRSGVRWPQREKLPCQKRVMSSLEEGKSPPVGEGVVVVLVVVEGAMLVYTAGKMEEKKKVVA